MSHFAASDIFFALGLACFLGAMWGLGYHVARCWDQAKHASARLHERHHDDAHDFPFRDGKEGR